jgi:hypothetical protein
LLGRGASKTLPIAFEQLVFIVNTFQRATDLPVPGEMPLKIYLQLNIKIALLNKNLVRVSKTILLFNLFLFNVKFITSIS